MAETLRDGLPLALSGFAFWARDIDGFEGLPDPALYKPWVQWGLLGSHFRLQGRLSPRVPWIYDSKRYPGEDEACSKVLRESVACKLALMPHLLRTALEGHLKGTPVMQAMFLEFGGTGLNTLNLDTQYMLGSDLLVAPVFDEGGEVTFYVPLSGKENTPGADSAAKQSKWRSFFDHVKTYEEGRWYTESHGFDTLKRRRSICRQYSSCIIPRMEVLLGKQKSLVL